MRIETFTSRIERKRDINYPFLMNKNGIGRTGARGSVAG
jgi:hypothetical protein